MPPARAQTFQFIPTRENSASCGRHSIARTFVFHCCTDKCSRLVTFCERG